MPRRLSKIVIGRVLAGGISRSIVTRALSVAGLLGVLLGAGLTLIPAQPAVAAVGINQAINFQGKLVNSNGTNVPNGTYNVQFKLYTAGNGCVGGGSSPCGGTLQWTESHLRNSSQGVTVTDGVFQVNLGEVTALPAIFNNDTIWLSINLGNTNATCTPFTSCAGDGEMLPFIRFTAAPYAINSDLLDGLDSSAFAQLNPATAQSGSLNVTGSVQAATSIQAPLVDTATAVALSVGTGTASSVTVGRATSSTNLTLQGSASTSWTATGASGSTTVNFASPTATNTITFPNASGTVCTTTASTCSATYQTASATGYLFKDAMDISSANVSSTNTLYAFNNTSSSVGSGVLKLNNGSNTASTLLVTASGNPGAGAALIKANNTNGTPSGNLIDLQVNGTSKFAADAAGAVTAGTYNGQTISATASFTGTVAVANTLSITAGGITQAGGAVSLNNNSNNNTSINTGTSTGTVTIGGGAGDLVINSTAFDVSSLGAVSGVTNMLLSGTISGGTTYTASTSLQSPLVDTASAVAMNIGTGTASSVTIGRATSSNSLSLQGSAASNWTVTGASGSTTVNFANPTATNTITFPNAGGTVCTTTASTCNSTYQVASATGYLTKNAQDTSSANVTGNLYSFTNSSSLASGVLALSNNGTNAALAVTANNNPSGAGQAIAVINNANGTPSGTSLDIQKGGSSMLSVDYNGNVTTTIGAGTGKINGQTISATASFTGTVATASTLTVSSGGIAVTGNSSIAGSLGSVTSLTLSGAISGGTSYSGSGNINTTGGTVQTASTDRIDNSGNLVNVGNITGTGGITVATSGTGTTNALVLQPAAGSSVTAAVTKSAPTGNETAYDLAVTVNKATSGNYTALKLNVTETSAPGSGNLLADLQVGSVSQFSVSSIGNVSATGSLTMQGTGNNTLSGQLVISNVTTDITTGTNENLTMVANGTGQIILNDLVQTSTLGTADTSTLLCRNTSNQIATCSASISGSAYVQGGNTFGADGDLGTNDAFALNLRSGGTTRLTLGSTGGLTLANGNNFTFAGSTGNFDQSASTTGTFKTGGGAVSLNGNTTVASGKTVTIQGSVAIQAATDTTSSFNIKNASPNNNNVFTVDTINSRVGIALSGNNTPASTLDVTGTLRLGGTSTESFVTPGTAVNVPTKINIPAFDPGANGQLLAFGLTSSAQTTARAISVFDARTAAHQPTLAVFSPDENNIVGLSWNGANSTGYLQTTDLTATSTTAIAMVSGSVSGGNGSSGNVTVQSGTTAGGTGSTTGTVFVVSGNGGGTNASSGNVTIDSGSKTGTGTTGVINLGIANASSVVVGRSAGAVSLNADTTLATGKSLSLSSTGNISGGATYSALTSVVAPLFDSSAAALSLGTSSATSVTLGRTSTAFLIQGDQTSTITSTNSTGGFKTTLGFTATTGSNKAVNIPNEAGTLCIQNSANCGFVVGSATSFLARNAHDTSSAAYTGNLYDFTNTDTGASGVLSLTSAGTNSTLSVTASGNPSSGNALILANNTNASPGGTNLLDLQANAVSKFKVSAGGSVTTASTINAQTISATANFTGTVTSASTLTVTAGGLTVTSGNATITSGNLTVTAGSLTSAGGAVSLNATSNFNTSINTGTSNGTITLGGGSAALVIDSTNFDVTSAGAVSGVTSLTASATIQGGTLNATTAIQANGTPGVASSCSAGQARTGATYSMGILTTAGTCTTVGAGSYLAKDAQDTSSAAVNGAYLYAFTNSGTGAGTGVLSLTNSNSAGTGSVLSVTSAANAAAGQALILANNTNGSASGNLLDLQVSAVSKFAVSAGGVVTLAGSQTTDITVASAAAASNGKSLTLTAGTAGSGNQSGGALTLNGGTGTGGCAASACRGGTVNINGGTASSTGAGGLVVISAAAGGSSAAAGQGAGGSITLQAGSAAGSNANAGGSITLSAGVGAGGGTPGTVNIGTPVFTSVSQTFTQTSNNQGFTSTTDPTLLTNLDTYGTIVMNVTGAFTGATVTMPAPSNTVAGRVVYVSANSSSVSFTLAATGMSSVNMSPGNTATLVWNGSSWSGTTTASSLQQVYNNTSTSPASIITTSASKNILLQAGVGFDNANVFQVGNSLAAPVLAVDTTNTATGVNLAQNSGVESGSGCPPTGWSAFAGTGSATVCLNSTASNLAAGLGSLDVNVTGVGTGGANNLLNATALASSTTYNVSFNVMATVSSPTLAVQYYRDNTSGGTLDATCTIPTNGTISTTSFFKYTCSFTTTASGNTKSTTNFLRISQASSAAKHIYIDNLFIGTQNTSGTKNTADLRVGGPLSQGLTLFTLDTFASAPFTGAINQDLYGSMYYDTTAGRIQCYESDGWGSCGAAPDSGLILEPEYAGAVLSPVTYNGETANAHIGTMTASICSEPKSIQPSYGSICTTGEEYNYYQWTTSQVTSQSYSIFVKYQLPPTFGGFQDANTIKMVGRVSNTTDAALYYTVFRGSTECGGTGTRTTVSTSANAWNNVSLASDETACSFAPNDIVTFEIDMYAKNNAYAYASQITFTMKGK